ncbi:MAG: hypothetical protein O9303_01355 [Silanimonas sp.]|nr:hypothetical protein [Silanimonas sp.]
MTRYSDPVTPWSYVLPIALGVLIGTLLSDAVRLAFARIVFQQATADFNRQLQQLMQQGIDPQRDSVVVRQESLPSAPLPVYPPPRSDAPTGSLACSQGAILRRIEGGWEQVGRSAGGAACRSSSR